MPSNNSNNSNSDKVVEEGEDIEDCESCRLNVGAAVMINLCEEIDCLKDRIDCGGLVTDFKADKITAREIIDKVTAAADDSGDELAIDLIAKLRSRIYVPESKPSPPERLVLDLNEEKQ